MYNPTSDENFECANLLKFKAQCSRTIAQH